MQAIRAKLNSRRGASILLALLVFLICAMAGMGALTAASSNLGRYRYAEEEEQAYLAVSSAARLVAEALQQSTYIATYTETKTEEKDSASGEWIPSQESHIPQRSEPDIKMNPTTLQGLLGDDLNKLFYQKFRSDLASGAPGERSVTFKLDDRLPVSAKFKLAENGTFKGDFWVKEDRGELYRTTLEVSAKELKESQTGEPSVSEDEPKRTTTTRYTYTLTWHTATFTQP